VALGVLGPLAWGAWQYYNWMIRYDPQTGYVGLHKVWVLVANLAVFLALGVLLGWGLRAVWERTELPQVGEAEGPVSSPSEDAAPR
jgi:hypothetical protein